MTGQNTAVLSDSKQNSFQELTRQVLEKVRNPVDRYEIAATLESMGWNDKRARSLFGLDDVFVLAEKIWDTIRKDHLEAPVEHARESDFGRYIAKIIRSFLRGSIFALPMAVSVTAMLTLRFSLWSYEYLSVSAATSIAIGTILSFVIVGGFIQALARFGFMYLNQGYVNMARKSVYYFVRIGFVTSLVTALLFFIFNWLFSIYPWQMSLLIILFLIFLSGIWLSVTVMYILQKELVFTGLITLGIGIVFILFLILKMNIIVSQLISLGIIAVLGVLTSHLLFLRSERQKDMGISPDLPRKSVMYFICLPYFKYGFLYFLFLNLDRIVAWSANTAFMPYFIWFRGEYELGLDFALLVLILPMGLVEVVVNEIMFKLVADQKTYSISQLSALSSQYLRFYLKRLIFIGLFCIVNSIALFFLIRFLEYNGFIHLRVFRNHITLFVFIWALGSYSLLSLGLMNTLILFCLSYPSTVAKSIFIAVIVNAVIGFILSRWIAYYWAVIGLAVGTVVFLVLSLRSVIKVLSNLDYYLYSAQ
ncbi:MAG: hypothetical protein GX434_07520 [Peptococcaceae bacterium]|nr:hypothetical protein [Peptococcaceae bacterium]